MDITTILAMTGLGMTYNNGAIYDSSGQLATPQELSNLATKINTLQSQGAFGTSSSTQTNLTSLLTTIDSQTITGIVGGSSSGSGNSGNNNNSNNNSQSNGSNSSNPKAPSGILNTIGTYAGIISLAGLFQSTNFGSGLLPNVINNMMDSMAFSGVLAGVSAFGLYQGLVGLLNGQINAMSLISTALSGIALVHTLIFVLGLTNPMTALIMGAILLAAILTHFLTQIFGHKENQSLNTQQGDVPNMPAPPAPSTSWLGSIPSSSVIFLSSGLALMSMGINLSSTAPTYQLLNVPSVALPQLNNALSAASGQSITSPMNDVFVLKGSGNTPDRAVIVTPGQNGGDSVQVVTLDSNGNIVGPLPPNAAYIPFYNQSSNGLVANQNATQALYAQNDLLAVSQNQGVSSNSRSAAAHIAASESKYVIPNN